LGPRLAWRTADRIWRAAGDEATDFNHYSKRAILSGVYLSTLSRWFASRDGGTGEAFAFLDRRLADVGRFERFKSKMPKADPSDLVAALGRLRYGSGR
jgi:ubiquinone biosynthesis protein COQ9